MFKYFLTAFIAALLGCTAGFFFAPATQPATQSAVADPIMVPVPISVVTNIPASVENDRAIHQAVIEERFACELLYLEADGCDCVQAQLDAELVESGLDDLAARWLAVDDALALNSCPGPDGLTAMTPNVAVAHELREMVGFFIEQYNNCHEGLRYFEKSAMLFMRDPTCANG